MPGSVTPKRSTQKSQGLVRVKWYTGKNRYIVYTVTKLPVPAKLVRA